MGVVTGRKRTTVAELPGPVPHGCWGWRLESKKLSKTPTVVASDGGYGVRTRSNVKWQEATTVNTVM